MQLELPFDDDTQAAWDRFAAAVLTGVAANPNSGCNSPRDYAHWAAACADAVMTEREKRREEL